VCSGLHDQSEEADKKAYGTLAGVSVWTLVVMIDCELCGMGCRRTSWAKHLLSDTHS